MANVSFEHKIAQAWNAFFSFHEIAGMARKVPMVRYQVQGFDVLVDSRHYEYYQGIECKSVDTEEVDMLYFSRYFHVTKGVHQLDYESYILRQSGRLGFLAVELRRKPPAHNAAFLVPWKVVMARFDNKEVGLPLEVICAGAKLEKQGSRYVISDDCHEAFMMQMSGRSGKRKPFKSQEDEIAKARKQNWGAKK